MFRLLTGEPETEGDRDFDLFFLLLFQLVTLDPFLFSTGSGEGFLTGRPWAFFSPPLMGELERDRLLF